MTRGGAPRPSVVVIGNFDGVHAGHQSLIARARAAARELQATSGEPTRVVAITFWPHPLAVLAPQAAPDLLCSLPERIALLRQAGADEVRVVPFTAQLAAWSPERFVETVLVPTHPVRVIVGENFSFGAGAKGRVADLRALGEGRFEVEALDLVAVDGQQSNSTLIRQALQAGEIAEVNRHLGRPFRVSGLVVVGDQRGHALGFPTANLLLDAGLALPADGVYAGWLRPLDQSAERLPAAISVGTNPTFQGCEKRVEAYVLDRDDLALYGVQVSVDFVAHLRAMVRFGSVHELIGTMHKDVARARELLGVAVPA